VTNIISMSYLKPEITSKLVIFQHCGAEFLKTIFMNYIYDHNLYMNIGLSKAHNLISSAITLNSVIMLHFKIFLQIALTSLSLKV
jgi:hypothetical protein